jgi:diguanylate cyclase (GGDEF)-like protein
MEVMQESNPQDNGGVPRPDHFDEDLERATRAAEQMIDANRRIWHPVETDMLDVQNPLTDRERQIIKKDAAGTLEAHHELSEQTKRIKELEEDARNDEKTGLRTFAVLQDELPRAISLTKREKSDIALMMIDGRGLKWVNDHISHAVGDEYIKTIAKALNASIRKSDAAYRGGKESDEFFVMMPLIHPDGASGMEVLAQRIKMIEKEFEDLVVQNPDLKQAYEQNKIGLYIGEAYESLAGQDPIENEKLAEKMLADADAVLRSEKRRQKALGKMRLRQQGQDIPADDRDY